MGPTCSIFYEREPVEENIMKLPPRQKQAWMFEANEFLISIIQGLVITTGILIVYFFYTRNGHSLEEVRTIVFTTLIFANIFLTFVNRSFTETLTKTIRYKNKLALPVLVISIGFLISIHMLPLVRNIFGMAIISTSQFLVCLSTALVTVIWFELYKALKR